MACALGAATCKQREGGGGGRGRRKCWEVGSWTDWRGGVEGMGMGEAEWSDDQMALPRASPAQHSSASPFPTACYGSGGAAVAEEERRGRAPPCPAACDDGGVPAVVEEVRQTAPSPALPR